jgi:hypothetical protein
MMKEERGREEKNRLLYFLFHHSAFLLASSALCLCVSVARFLRALFIGKEVLPRDAS